MKQIIIILASLIVVPIFGQQSITLQECYDLATVNYPLAKQSQLFAVQNQLEKEVVSNAKLPQLSLDAQATYQSEVIEIPIPNSSIAPLNKDQYRATLSVNQLIYNGGATNAALAMQTAQLNTKQKQVEVNLYQLKYQINQLYFSILLSNELELLLKAKQNQLLAKLKEVAAGVKYGVLLASSNKVLEAELLKLDQQFQELESNKITLIETLGSIVLKPLDNATIFQNPLVESQLRGDLSRPELELFNYKKEEITSSETLIGKQNAPMLLGFATGGYGNPGLNMLDNSFQTFYIVGVKFNWKVFDWNSNNKQRESLIINKDIVDTETEVFKLNTNIELNKLQKEIEKMETLMVSDEAIINLRKEVLQTAESQLKNGVITTSAYITEITNLYEDENTLVRHKIQSQLAKANYNVIKGL